MLKAIRFLKAETYETQGPGKGPKFEEGQVVSIEEVPEILGGDFETVSRERAEAWLRRWTNRGVAVDADEKHGLAEIAGAADPENEDPETEPVNYKNLSRAELDALAAARGVDIAGASKKDDVIAALELADEAAAAGEGK